ncbi:unnamed protein product [Discula destructiva]
MPEKLSSRHTSPAGPTVAAQRSDDGTPGDILTPPSSAKRVASHGFRDISPVPFPHPGVAVEGDLRPDILSPPLSPDTSPTTRRKRFEPMSRRLRAKGGLKIHVNGSTLRHYTEYDAFGTPPSPFFAPVPWTENTFGEPDVQTSLESIKDDSLRSLPIFDIFATKAVKAVLGDSAATERLRQFADTRGQSKDIDFLLQIAEFHAKVDLVASTMHNVTAKFTGVAATSPVRLPPAVGRSLSGDMRDASNNLLPNLHCLFDEASTLVEQSLSLGVYPDFLKHQVSLYLQTIRPGSTSIQSCRGFADAFCMTDSREYGNHIVYASTGLASLTGYTLAELVHKDCRTVQGPFTSGACVDRMRDALSQHTEYTELVVNYTKTGQVYWNLVFMARLVGADGEVEYHLGGQIDVTEVLEREEDLIDVLRHVPPLAERPPATEDSDQQDRRRSWRGGLRERRHERERDPLPKYPPSVSRNRFLRSFRRSHSEPENSADLSAADTSTRAESQPSLVPTQPPSPSHRMVVSPYSRFMVMECVKPSGLGDRFDEKHGRPQLPLAFCSKFALESFGGSVKHTAADLVGLGIFDVLSDKARSPSITNSFKSTVRENLAKGRSAKLEITLGGSRRKRSRGVSTSRKPSLSGTGSETPSGHRRSLRKSLSLEMLVPLPGGHGSEASEDFVSYWTPLKNELGVTQWVVLILVPIVI